MSVARRELPNIATQIEAVLVSRESFADPIADHNPGEHLTEMSHWTAYKG